MNCNLEKLKYPIGKFKNPNFTNPQQFKNWITIIEAFPLQVTQEVKGLNDTQLEKTYRPNGWTIKQIIHHCADSHINSFIRFKLALTENTPTIKPYYENLWAELTESKNFPIESSLKILEGIHQRWVHLLKNLSISDLNREFKHPETNQLINLKTNIGLYAWHCQHHLAHIKNAKKDNIYSSGGG